MRKKLKAVCLLFERMVSFVTNISDTKLYVSLQKHNKKRV